MLADAVDILGDVAVMLPADRGPSPEGAEPKLTSAERRRLDAWTRDHFCGAAERAVSVAFNQAGIGTAKQAYCVCGAVTDLTDYESW